jgi:leucyl-tRNA synthetase
MNADGADTPIDHWLRSRIQEYIKSTTLALDSFQTRQAIHLAFFSMERDLRWYKKRLCGAALPHTLMRGLASVWIRLLCPIIPFTAEQLWKEMGEEGLCSFALWPRPDEAAIDIRCENAEELLMRTEEDLESILRIIQITPKSVTIVVAPEWKWEIFSKVQQSSAQGTGNIIKELMQDPEIRTHGEDAVGAVKDCAALIHRLPPDLATSLAATPPHEMQIFSAAKSFIEHAFSVSVTVVSSDESVHDKAKHAAPFKPAIIIE